MEKWNYKKAYKDLYMPKKKPSAIQVPKMTFIMVDGRGNPNTSKDYKTPWKFSMACLLLLR